MAEEKPQESDLDVMSQLSERMKGVGKEAKSLNLKLSRFLEAQKQQAKSTTQQTNKPPKQTNQLDPTNQQNKPLLS